MSTLTLSAAAKEALGEDLAVKFLALAEPVVGYEFGAAPKSATESYVGGHPFMPRGEAWPVSEESNEPLVFLLQVNFADLPPVLEGFPREGIVQWFVDGADDTFGLTWSADSTGREGLVVHYYSPDAFSKPHPEPTALLPYRDLGGEERGPFESLAPRRLAFSASEALPRLRWRPLPAHFCSA